MQICVVNEEDMQIVNWSELVIGLVVLGVLWYGYFVLRYYRKAIIKFSQNKRNSDKPAKWIRESPPVNNDPAKSDPHAQVHELMQELKLVFAAAVKDQLQTQQILDAIGIRLSKYTTLPVEIKLSIAQHIVNEFFLQVKITVTQEEINALW